jgi:hypothetical protein
MTSVARSALLLAVVALVAACGPASGGNPSASPAVSPSPALTGSGIEGTVMLGPTCPVQRSGQPPCEVPVATTVEILDPAGSTVASVQSGSDGRFRAGLPPGEYRVLARPTSTGRGMVGAPVDVTVPPGGYVTVTVTLDTGIR